MGKIKYRSMEINMDTQIGLLNMIRQKKEHMSKGQKKLADYILCNYEKAAFLTALQLGKEVGVSESTVVRFASGLGLEGYPEFQKQLAGMVQEKIHSIERIEIAGGTMAQEMVLDNVMNADADKIKLTLENIDRNAFKIAVDSILDAKNVYIVGVRSCSALATFLEYYLKLVRQNVYLISSSNTSELFEQMLHVSEEDVVIGISFPRYSMRTLKAMEFANNRNAKVIAITDSKHSPMNMYSSCNLLARSDMASIVDSLVAPMSVINALIVALCLRKNEDVIHNLETLEQVIYDYQYDNNDEINLLDEDIMAELRKMSPKE
jgi:DNA-binding MurR/RpiR family transcriptional regulator